MGITCIKDHRPEHSMGDERWHNGCAQCEIEQLRELLQSIVDHHDQKMHESVGDEANYHEMRRNLVLFCFTLNSNQASPIDGKA